VKRALLAVTIAAAVLFTAFPGIDLAVSDLFYRPNGGFHLRDAWWAVTLYESVPVVAIVVGGGGALLLAHNLVRRRQTGPFSSRFLL
jgi:membrane-associated PAP2 superfamily phosphatase